MEVMSDDEEQHEHDEENNDEIETHSDGDVVMVGPAAFIQAQREAHDRLHAQAQELRASTDRLLDELNAEQTYSLLSLITHLAASNDTSFAHYLAGQCAAIMRIKHKACITCGSEAHETSMHGI